MFQVIGVDSNIIRDIKLGRTKCTNIIKNVVGAKMTQDLVNTLKQNFFSILVDESTDISIKKFLCILVRYCCPNTGQLKTELLELIEVDAKLTSAAKLYDHFCRALSEKNIPIKNIIGYASDRANVMMGDNNSFKSRLLKDTNALVVIKCICHSSAIVANKACKQLPRTPEDLIRAVATYVGASAKRCVNW